MRRPRDDGEDEGGLDSLLDTMTNVVGILVLVLIVTQMSVAEVVSRITEEVQVDEQQVAQMQRQLLAKRDEQAELERMLVDPLSIDPEKQRQELERQRELLERRKRLIAEKQKEKNDYAIKIDQDRQTAEATAKLMAETSQKKGELSQLITTSSERKAELEAMLEKTPNASAPADVVVTIPNPRPAPPGASPIVFICAHNELYPANLDLFRKNAEAKAKLIITRFRLDRNPQAGIDPDEFTKYYERLKDQDDFFDVEYFVDQKRYPRIRLVPRDGRGASDKELLNPRSRIRKEWLSNVDITKVYAQFNVLPDSYDVYITARRFFNNAELLSGWEPQPEGWQYISWIPGGIELGPPQEKPKPTTPAPPAKPANVID